MILFSTPGMAHVFYISVARVKWNGQHERLDLSVRIFTNDLEQAIQAKGGPELKLWTEGAHPESDRHIADYLVSRLRFRVNGRDATLEFVGKADALDATACFFQIRGIKTVRFIEVENRILIDLFDAQTNVMQFEVGDSKKFMNLDRSLYRETVKFD
jgi:hypothetical protein